MNFDKQILVFSKAGVRLDIGSKLGSITGVHDHDKEYQFEVLLSGKSLSMLNKKDAAVFPGHVNVYNPADLHEIDYQNTESFIFHLQAEAVKHIQSEMGCGYKEPIFDPFLRKKLNIDLSILNQEIKILEKINLLPSNSTIEMYKENKALTLLKLILKEIQTENISHKNLDYFSRTKVEKAKNWIDKNYGLENITLNYLASLSHLSKFHFIRVFKNLYGKTPYEYLSEVRVKAAVRILDEKNYVNMEKVSEMVGLKNAAQLRYHIKKFGVGL